MEGYRLNSACINCKYVFLHHWVGRAALTRCGSGYADVQWDVDEVYQCRHGRMAKPVPPGKAYTASELENYWSDTHLYMVDTGPIVEAHGVCDNYANK